MPEKNKSIYIIAEIAQAHDGSLGLAHSFIDAAKRSGADAVKFQTHIADQESTINEPWRIKFSYKDKSRYDYWKRMEFTEDEWGGLKEHADKIGIEFLSSPFSIQALELLIRVGVRKWKIASGEVSNTPLFGTIIKTGYPVLLSTGMSSMDEIDKAVTLFKESNTDLTLLQCTSMYPTPPEKLGLNLIQFYKERYKVKAGLSDHSGLIYPGIAAAALGADAVEVHLTMSKDMFGPDTPVSLTPVEFSTMVEGIRFLEKANANLVSKDILSSELEETRKLFNKSIVAKEELPVGTIVSESNIAFKKPGTGLSPDNAGKILGKKTKKLIKADELISLTDLE